MAACIQRAIEELPALSPAMSAPPLSAVPETAVPETAVPETAVPGTAVPDTVVDAEAGALVDLLVAVQRARAALDAADVVVLAALDVRVQAMRRAVERVDRALARGEALPAGAVGLGPELTLAEVGAALSVSPQAAECRIDVATQLTSRFPATLAAMQSGAVCWRKAAATVRVLTGARDEVATRVEAATLPKAPARTIAAHERALEAALIAADPAGHAERAHEAQQRRRVVYRPGTAETAVLIVDGNAVDLRGVYQTVDWLASLAAAADQAARDRGQVIPTRDTDAYRTDALIDVFAEIAATGQFTIGDLNPNRAPEPASEPASDPASDPAPDPDPAPGSVASDAAADPARRPAEPPLPRWARPRRRKGRRIRPVIDITVPVRGNSESDRVESDRVESDRFESDRFESDRFESDRFESDRSDSGQAAEPAISLARLAPPAPTAASVHAEGTGPPEGTEPPEGRAPPVRLVRPEALERLGPADPADGDRRRAGIDLDRIGWLSGHGPISAATAHALVRAARTTGATPHPVAAETRPAHQPHCPHRPSEPPPGPRPDPWAGPPPDPRPDPRADPPPDPPPDPRADPRAGPPDPALDVSNPAPDSPQGPVAGPRPQDQPGCFDGEAPHRPFELCQRPQDYLPRAALREHVIYRDRHCVFPGCGANARRCDLDHTRPYRPGHPDFGTTCAANLAPLCRRHHRLKTHGRWRLTQPEPGHFIWTSPLGRVVTVSSD